MLRMDKGPEFISLALAEWAKKHAVKLAFIQPGKPKKNVFITRFNRTYRTEILNSYLFRTLNNLVAEFNCWLTAYTETIELVANKATAITAKLTIFISKIVKEK